MYSKNRGITERRETVLTPPPGYDGSRFRRRSDGRDDAFPLYEQNDAEMQRKNEEFSPVLPSKSANATSFAKHSLFSFIGKEELLLIALLIILAGEKEADPDTLILLGLLLCVH